MHSPRQACHKIDPLVQVFMYTLPMGLVILRIVLKVHTNFPTTIYARLRQAAKTPLTVLTMTNLCSRRSSMRSPKKSPTFSLSPFSYRSSAAIATTNNSNLPISDLFFTNQNRHHFKPPMTMPRHQPTPTTPPTPSMTLSTHTNNVGQQQP